MNPFNRGRAQGRGGMPKQTRNRSRDLSNVPARHVSDPSVSARPDLRGVNKPAPKQFALSSPASRRPVTPVTNRPNHAAALRSYNTAPRGRTRGVQRNG